MRAALITLAAAAALLTASPALAQSTERIPRSIGMQGFAQFRTSNQMVPATVPSMRFRQLVKTSAQRWGLRARGQTSRIAGARDGLDVVGFGTDLPEGTLGVQQDFVVRIYRRRSRCRVRNGRRVGCKSLKPVYVGEHVTERDITVDPRLAWQPGPALPSAEQYDLETVLIHELGHMAGNKDHVAPCTNSPLWEALDLGEWWRSPADWHGHTCPNSPSTAPTPTPATPPALRAGAARRRASARRFAHRRTVVGRVLVSR